MSTITTKKSGLMIMDGSEAVEVYRLATIISGMRLEMLGMRLTRKAPSCFTIARKQYGLKGNKASLFAQMQQFLIDQRAKVSIIND
jgi:hypothetical protein